jgi:cysteate synthase
MPRHYKLRCQVCDARFDDDGFILECPNKHTPSLLTTEYVAKEFEPDKLSQGIFRYRNWLPACQEFRNTSSTVTYQNEKLNHYLGLPNLWIVFNGYWPEKGATHATATFKELEAYSVLARIPRNQRGVLVIASAGNTAAAFAHACSQHQSLCLIIIPESGLQRMQFFEPLDPCVRVVSLTGFTDYYDAIKLADYVSSRLDSFFLEGSVRNVGRRDGIGTSMLNAVETIGRLPDYYFQAIGSGAGGIAVHEAAKRLVNDGRFGQKLPRLMLSQNFPFVPIYQAWQSKCRELIDVDSNIRKQQVRQIVADVLSNQRPPYSLRGGVFDVLMESQGNMLAASNREALHATALFQEIEGVDIEPAAGIALATLVEAAAQGEIEREAHILLHITGGGWHKRKLDKKLLPLKPSLELDECEIGTETALEKITELF